VNTRTGWYSKAVTEATDGAGHADGGRRGPDLGRRADHGFRASRARMSAGEIVAVGEGRGCGPDRRADHHRQLAARPGRSGLNKDKTGYFGSERDGGFAEYTTMPAANALAVRSDLSDAELATFSCSYSTAEGMLTRAAVTG
jgi:threonine dehydrogenase-like Zn-dependent dehydrogenase